jgi:hypothetical protein
MTVFSIALLFISALAILYFIHAYKRRYLKRKFETNSATLSQRKSPFHAVSIVFGDQACEAVRSCTGIKYLSSEAPRLPIAGCQNRICTCHYEHYKDRREESRRAIFGSNRNPYGILEKRVRDRRISAQAS